MVRLGSGKAPVCWVAMVITGVVQGPLRVTLATYLVGPAKLYPEFCAVNAGMVGSSWQVVLIAVFAALDTLKASAIFARME